MLLEGLEGHVDFTQPSSGSTEQWTLPALQQLGEGDRVETPDRDRDSWEPEVMGQDGILEDKGQRKELGRDTQAELGGGRGSASGEGMAPGSSV